MSDKYPIGKITCPIAAAAGEPHAGQVFEQDSRKRSLYYRCECGTIQPLTAAGQASMRKLMKALDLKETDDAVIDATADAAVKARDAAKKGRKDVGLVQRVLGALLSEEPATTEDKGDE